MNPNRVAKSLIGALVGGSFGFVLGCLAIFAFGIMGCMGPIVGGILGAAVGGVAHPVASLCYLGGMFVSGAITFAHFNAEAHARIGPTWRWDVEDSPLYFAAPMGLAMGIALIGGAVAASIVAAILIRKNLSQSLATFAVVAVVTALGFLEYEMSRDAYESWVAFESGYQQSMRTSGEAEKRRLAPGPRDLPVQAGPFLYPNRIEMKGDSYTVNIRTTDLVPSVLAYYEKLGARMSAAYGGWEGTFPYEHKTLKVRIAEANPAGSNIVLTVAGY